MDRYREALISSQFMDKGASINYVEKQGGGSSNVNNNIYIILCSKLVNEGGGGQNSVNIVYECPQDVFHKGHS